MGGVKGKGKHRQASDEELLALRCACGEPIYTEVPEGGFHFQSRIKPRGICAKCARRQHRERRNARHKGVQPEVEAEVNVVGVLAKTCGHQWIAKTIIPLGLLRSGEAKMRCPVCDCGRRVELTGEQDRICARCDKKLSMYNPGTLCHACDAIEREQWLKLTKQKMNKAAA